MGVLVFAPNRRVYVCGLRVHHGLTGVLLIAVGVVLVAHDWADRPWRVRDLAG